MKILFIGGTGRIGGAIRKHIGQSINLFTPTSTDLNVSNYSQIQKSLKIFQPDVVINTAVVGVDVSEQNPELADCINHLSAGNLAKVCALFDIPLIHLSTDYVFSGNQNIPYHEDDEAAPVNNYGRSKLAGEHSVINHQPRSIIFRTSWVFGDDGHSFVRTILSLAKTNLRIDVVKDEVSCPTFVDDIATALILISKRILNQFNNWGIYHYCGNEYISRYNYALEILEIAKRYNEFKVKNIQPVLSKEFPAIAQRPLFSAMSSEKTQKIFGVNPCQWRLNLKKILAKSDSPV